MVKDQKRLQCICVLVILIESVLRQNKNYYPQAFLEECE